MVEAACQTYTAAATLSADPITLENENFWRIAGNLFVMSNAKLIAPCPEVAALVDLSKAIAGCSSHWDWASARAICDRLFDSGDGGEELGFSGAFRACEDWYDADQREVALRAAMQWHRVPKAFQAKMAEVVAGLMLAMPQAWVYPDEGNHLPQPWATCCTYVVAAIAHRVTDTDPGTNVDGGHRGFQ